jgi:Domain of unknown function (DUF6046)
MSIKLDDIDLTKKVIDSDGASILEIRNITQIEIYDRRNIIELNVSGNEGDILQDMGCDPVRISLWGEFMGKDSLRSIEYLQSKFDSHKPFDFSSDLSYISEIKQIIINDFYLVQVAGLISRYKYRINLTEYNNQRQ